MGYSVGKWTKYKLMIEDEKLKMHLPETNLVRKDSFWRLLDTYREVVVKPCIGYRGKSVLKVLDLGNEKYEIHDGFFKNIVSGREETYDYLKEKFFLKRKFIVQKVVPLAIIDNNPFDLRIMIQRKKNTEEWEVTGAIARVAAKGFFITNAAKEVLNFEDAVDKSNININIRDLNLKINNLAVHIAKQLEKYYTKSRTIGIDLGIDEKGDLWILEANLRPSIAMFKKLDDQSFYEMIKHFKKS